MSNERLKRDKEKANNWLINMGLKPRINRAGKAIWETEFKGNDGAIHTRKKTIKGKNNPYTSFHSKTTGVALTKKVVKERPDYSVKTVKQRANDHRETPQHYKDLVQREYLKRLKESDI